MNLRYERYLLQLPIAEKKEKISQDQMKTLADGSERCRWEQMWKKIGKKNSWKQRNKNGMASLWRSKSPKKPEPDSERLKSKIVFVIFNSF